MFDDGRMFWNVFLSCSPFSNTLLLNSFMIRTPLDSFVSLGSLQHYCWLHRNFPRRNKVPGPGKHFLIEIPLLRKWCHSHSHMRHNNVTNYILQFSMTMHPSHKCSANSSIHPILCNTSPLRLVRLSGHHHIPSFAQFETKLSSDWNNKHGPR